MGRRRRGRRRVAVISLKHSGGGGGGGGTDMDGLHDIIWKTCLFHNVGALFSKAFLNLNYFSIL